MKSAKIVLPDDIYAALQAHAEADRRSMVKEMEYVITRYVINTPVPKLVIPGTDRQAS
jgi:hypothetical protein